MIHFQCDLGQLVSSRLGALDRALGNQRPLDRRLAWPARVGGLDKFPPSYLPFAIMLIGAASLPIAAYAFVVLTPDQRENA